MARRNRLKKKLAKLLPVVTITLTSAPFVSWSPSASAFFPPIWPVNPPVAVVPPSNGPPVVTTPPVSPPPFVVSPPSSPPPVIVVPPSSPPPITVPPLSPPPNSTPEPATVVSGLIGLAAIAGYGLKRRHEKKKAE